jgi:hypothetical protein
LRQYCEVLPFSLAKSFAHDELSPDANRRVNARPCRGVSASTACAIKLSPLDQDFGTIPPLGQVRREFNVNTERADQRKYQIKFNLMYDSNVPAHECDQEEFVVVPD